MTVFIGGVHGAGKTFLTKPACERLGLVYATASQLIREERGLATWSDDKTVRDVDENQFALIRAVNRISAEGRRLVLDGHFVLRKAAWEHERLSLDVFRELGFSSVLVIQNPVLVVLDRLAARGDTSWNATEVAQFCAAEAAHGSHISEQLDVSFELLESPNADIFESRLSYAVSHG